MNWKRINAVVTAVIVAFLVNDTIAARKESKSKPKSNSNSGKSSSGGQRKEYNYDTPRATPSSYNNRQQNQNAYKPVASAPAYNPRDNKNIPGYGVPQQRPNTVPQSRPNQVFQPTQRSVPQSRPNQNSNVQQPGGYPHQQPGGYPQQQPGGYPHQQPGYQQPGGYPHQQPGYQQPGFQQPGYQQPGYQQPGFQQPGYQRPGYQQPGYQQPGYQQPGYQQPGYQQPGGYFGGGFNQNQYNRNNNKPSVGKQIFTHVAAAAGGALLMHQIGKHTGGYDQRREERERERDLARKEELSRNNNNNNNNYDNSNSNTNSNSNSNSNNQRNSFITTPPPFIPQPLVPFKIGYDESETASQLQADQFTANLVEDAASPGMNRNAPPLDEYDLAERERTADLSGYMLKHLRPSQSETITLGVSDGRSMRPGQNSQGSGGMRDRVGGGGNNNNYNQGYGLPGDLTTPGNDLSSTTVFPMIISQKQPDPQVLPLVIEEMPSLDPLLHATPITPNSGFSLSGNSCWILIFAVFINRYVLV